MDFFRILFARDCFNTGGDVHTPGFQYANSFADIERIQTTGYDYLCGFGHSLDQECGFLPVESFPRPAWLLRCTRIQKNRAKRDRTLIRAAPLGSCVQEQGGR